MNDIHPYALDCSLLIIYDYDREFLRAYLQFLDDVTKVFEKHHYVGDDIPAAYFGLTQTVELLLDRLFKDSRRVGVEDAAADAIFDDFTDELANDIIEELTDFLNRGIVPCGLHEISLTLDDGYYLVEVVFDTRNEATYYCFEDANA